MDQVTPDAIIQVAGGFMAAKHLAVASEIGLFAKLAEGPATLDALAERLGLPRYTTRITADAMVALGFVERDGDRYRNGPVAATYLSGQTPADLRPFLRFWDRLSYPQWMHLATAIRGGNAPHPQLDAEQQQIFSEGVGALTAGSALALAVSYDFGRHQRLLDLGGGTGSFLLAALARHPNLSGTLFETPSTAAVARPRLEAAPESQRIAIAEGDFLQDAIPEGHDVVLLANIVHLFSPEHNRALLRRIRERVAAGARLLLVDFWTDPTHTQPPFAALMAGEFLLVTGEGDVYSTAEMQDWLRETGWRFLEQRPLTGPSELIIAEAT